MKKIYTLLCVLMFTATVGKSQSTTVISDTNILNWMKQEVAYEIADINYNYVQMGLSNYCTIQCFSGNTFFIDSFSAVSQIFYYNYWAVNHQDPPNSKIYFPNKNISSMNGLQYFEFSEVDLSHNKIDVAGYRKLVTSKKWGQQEDGIVDLSYNLLGGILTDDYLRASYIKLNNNLFTGTQSPCTLNQIYYIKSLDLSHNLLQNADFVSNTIYNKMEKFDLSYNQIQNVGITGNTTIFDYIDLSYNQIEKSNIYVNASSINLSHNLLKDFLAVLELTNSCYVDLSYNQFVKFPSMNYGNGSSVNLSHNKLASLQSQYMIQSPLNASIQNNLYLLDISNNYIHDPTATELDNFGGSFYRLILDSNYLTAIPFFSDSIGYLSFKHNDVQCLSKTPLNLKTLVMDSGKLNCIPNPGNYTINGVSSLLFPICNPTNNVNGCKAFPTLTGLVYLDKNSNGVKDATEHYMANIKVDLLNGGSTFTNNDGRFYIAADSIGYQKININAPNNYTAFPNAASTTFTNYDSLFDAGNIGIRLTTIIDSVTISATPINWAARPGFSYPIVLNYKNVGTTNLSPTISLTYNNLQLIFDSCSNASAVNNGSSVSFNIANIDADETGYAVIYFRVQPPPLTAIGDTIITACTIVANASIAQSNTFTIIRGSFDPNEKDATPTLTTTQVAAGNYIDYTIHFQNTGNDTAFNIVVADTLSSLLQANSLQFVTSSHNCKTTLKGNKVYFEFRNILLPDSNVNQLGSNGFVRFRVKPVNTLVLGNIVPNKASIYFDYNIPILTNTATTTVSNVIITPVRITNYELRITNEGSQFPSNGGARGGSVLNKWATSTEINVSHYNIQRSEDARLFKTVGTIAAKGNGSYSFLDGLNSLLPSPLGDGLGVRLYYRLQAVDKDGQTSYSEVKRVTLNEKQETRNIVLYPNPTKDNITIESKGIKKVVITDCFGRIILQLNNITEHQTINTKQWNKGMYIVSFDNGEKVKVVKE